MINNKIFEEYKDMYNIYNLITFINKDYRLVFDKIKKSFNIINIAKNNQICLNFNSFSTNVLKNLNISKIENSKKLFKYIDDFNEKLTEKNIKNAKSKTVDAVKNLIDFSKKTNSINSNDIKKIIEGTIWQPR